MALYKVYFRLRTSESARTMNLDYPSESAAIAQLVKSSSIKPTDTKEIIIKKIEKV